MRFCPQCGRSSLDQQRFCMGCGAGLDAAPVVDLSSIGLGSNDRTNDPGSIGLDPNSFPAPLFPPAAPAKTSAKTIWLVVGAILLIVGIPILAVVAAIIIPTMMVKNASENETATIQTLQKLNHALTAYHDTYQHGYPMDLSLLGPRASGPPNEFGAALVDSSQTLELQSGYHFSYQARAPDSNRYPTAFVLYVDPVSTWEGERHFYLDQTGVIHVSRKTAGPESPALRQEDMPTVVLQQKESQSGEQQ